MPRRPPQLELRLRHRPTWGGRRARAGRKPKGDHAEIRHASRNDFRKRPAHVTLRLRSNQPSLRNVKIVREIERTLAGGCERPDFRLVHYSLQGNHAHLIVEADDRHALGRGMMAIGCRLARAVNRVTGGRGRVLADRYHARTLATPRECHRALRYVLLNSRRHAKATRNTREVRLDPASSALWFDGWKRTPSVTERIRGSGPQTPPVAPAHWWLLTKGWRKHGLLDAADVPG